MGLKGGSRECHVDKLYEVTRNNNNICDGQILR